MNLSLFYFLEPAQSNFLGGDQLEFDGLRNGKIGWLRAVKYFGHVKADLTKICRRVYAEGYHASIGKSVTSFTVLPRRKGSLFLLRVRAAQIGPERSHAQQSIVTRLSRQPITDTAPIGSNPAVHARGLLGTKGMLAKS